MLADLRRGTGRNQRLQTPEMMGKRRILPWATGWGGEKKAVQASVPVRSRLWLGQGEGAWLTLQQA